MSLGTILRRGFSETRFVAIGVLLLIVLSFPYAILFQLFSEKNGGSFLLQSFLLTSLDYVVSLFFTPLIIIGILRKLIGRAQQFPARETVVADDRVRTYPRMLGLYFLYWMASFALMLPMFCMGGIWVFVLLSEGVGPDEAAAQLTERFSSLQWYVLSFLASTVILLVWCLWCVACVILVDSGSTLDASIRRSLRFCKTNGLGFFVFWLTSLALSLPAFIFYWLASYFGLWPPESPSAQAALIFPAVWNAITLGIGLSLATSLYVPLSPGMNESPADSVAY